MNVTTSLFQTLGRHSSTLQTVRSIQQTFADRDYFYRQDLLVRIGKVEAPVKSYLGKLMILEMEVASATTNYPRLTRLAYVLHRSGQIVEHLR